jgi:hypothetical protein
VALSRSRVRAPSAPLIDRVRGGPLGQREFRLLFLGRTTSFVGNAFANIALAFAVLDLTGSKADLGYVLAARLASAGALLARRGHFGPTVSRATGSWSRRTSRAASARVR